MKKMLFVFNPKSGKSQIKSKLMEILDRFTKSGYDIEIYVTQAPHDAHRKVLESGEGKDIVVCSGGDGTLNEVAGAIMELERRPAIGYIPAGTTNDFASSHGIPKNMLKAADLITDGNAVPFDMGRMNDKYFVYVAAFGAFTDVPYATPQETKAVLGHQAYILEGAKRLRMLKPYHCRIEIAGEVVEKDLMVGMVSNANRIAGMKGLNGRHVALDDGLFEVLLVEYSQNLLELTDAMTSLIQPNHVSKLVFRYVTASVRFSFDEPVDWVLDGEFGGSLTEVEIENCRQALAVMKKVENGRNL